MGHAVQSGSDEFLSHRRHILKFFLIDSVLDTNGAESIEIGHRQTEFFLEKFTHVKHSGTAAGKKNLIKR